MKQNLKTSKYVLFIIVALVISLFSSEKCYSEELAECENDPIRGVCTDSCEFSSNLLPGNFLKTSFVMGVGYILSTYYKE